MKAIKLILFIISIFCLCFILWSWSSCQSKINLLKAKEEDLNNLVIRHAFYGGGIGFDGDTRIFQGNKQISLDSVLNEKPKLVFRFNDLNCESCIEALLPTLKIMSNKLGNNNTILFVSHENPNYPILFCNDHNIEMPIYSIPYDSYKDIDKLNTPYFFVLYPNKHGYNTYIPEKDMIELTSLYLDKIQELFQVNNN